MPEPDRRSPLTVGFEWASRISVAGATFFVPILAGHGVDRLAGSGPIGLMVGLVIGFAVGLTQLIRIAGDSSRTKP